MGSSHSVEKLPLHTSIKEYGFVDKLFWCQASPVSPHPSRSAEGKHSHRSWSNSAPCIQQHVLLASYLILCFVGLVFFFFNMHHQRRVIQYRHTGVEVFRQALKNVVWGFCTKQKTEKHSCTAPADATERVIIVNIYFLWKLPWILSIAHQ